MQQRKLTAVRTKHNCCQLTSFTSYTSSFYYQTIKIHTATFRSFSGHYYNKMLYICISLRCRLNISVIAFIALYNKLYPLVVSLIVPSVLFFNILCVLLTVTIFPNSLKHLRNCIYLSWSFRNTFLMNLLLNEILRLFERTEISYRKIIHTNCFLNN